MNVGIKVGPADWKQKLEQIEVKYCEVWYRVDWREKYTELFSYLKEHGIAFGLHFWGTVDGKYFPNLCYPYKGIAEKSYYLIRESVDVAGRVGAFYVNYHPESLRLMELDLDRSECRVAQGRQIEESEGYESLCYYSSLLRSDARYMGTDIYIETVPLYVPSHFREGEKDDGRLTPLFSYGMPTKHLIEMGKLGFHLTYDIGHVTGQYPDMPRADIYTHIKHEAELMAPYTKLVHVNTTIDPLNGTDSHHGVLEEDFALNVFPDKGQVMELLSIFSKNKDTLVIPEPQNNRMVENYRELVALCKPLA